MTVFVGAMGPRNCCLMKGHGIRTVGPSVEAATLLAIRLENLARMHMEIARCGREAPIIAQEDIDTFIPPAGAPRGPGIPRPEEWTWNCYVQLPRDGVGVPEDLDAP